MTTFSEVLSAAQNLPPSDQLRLIDDLWDKLPPDAWPLPSEEWISEANRRTDAYEAGEMTSSTWPEVRERARRKAGLDG